VFIQLAEKFNHMAEAFSTQLPKKISSGLKSTGLDAFGFSRKRKFDDAEDLGGVPPPADQTMTSEKFTKKILLEISGNSGSEFAGEAATPPEKNSNIYKAASKSFKELSVWKLDPAIIQEKVKEMMSTSPSAIPSIRPNQYLSPRIQFLNDSDLAFEQDLPHGHCAAMFTRTMHKGGVVAEGLKLREGGSNNDHPRLG
jgi:hypothetical protein